MLKSYTDALQQRKCFKTSRDGRINSQSPFYISTVARWHLGGSDGMFNSRASKIEHNFVMKEYFYFKPILKHEQNIHGHAPTKESIGYARRWSNKFAESVLYFEQDIPQRSCIRIYRFKKNRKIMKFDQL